MFIKVLLMSFLAAFCFVFLQDIYDFRKQTLKKLYESLVVLCDVTFPEKEVGPIIHSSFVIFFEQMGHSWPLFLYFRLFNTVDSKMFNMKFCR